MRGSVRFWKAILFLLANVSKSALHVALLQRRESEACAPRLKGWDDLADIIADQTEPCVASVFFYHCN